MADVIAVFEDGHVVGTSMIPTLHHNDIVLGVRVPGKQDRIRKLIRRKLVAQGAIVRVRLPGTVGRLTIKRIDGMPGDLRVWGLESQITDKIPEGHVFLVGDAGGYSRKPSGVPADSRLYGPISSTQVIARTFLRCVPPTRFAVLH